MQSNHPMEKGAHVSQAAVAYSSSKVRKLKCMFTTQVNKKRKAWSDGFLKIFFSGGTYQCSLIDCSKIRETSLVGRQLEAVEVQKLKKNEEIELEFEGYLVTVLAGNEYDETKVGPPLKLPKFVPPSVYVPTNRPTSVQSVPQRNVTAASSNPGAPYKVTADELDDIWDRETPTKPPARDKREFQDNRSSQHPQYVEMAHRESSLQGPGRTSYNEQHPQYPAQRRPNSAEEHSNGQRPINKYFTAKSCDSAPVGYQQPPNPASTIKPPSNGACYTNAPPNRGPSSSNRVPTVNNVSGTVVQPPSQAPQRATAPAQLPHRAAAKVNVQVPAQRSSFPHGEVENYQRSNSGSVGGHNANYANKPAAVVQPAIVGNAAPAPVPAPAPAYQAASYQPASYSTIIGSSVWDSD